MYASSHNYILRPFYQLECNMAEINTLRPLKNRRSLNACVYRTFAVAITCLYFDWFHLYLLIFLFFEWMQMYEVDDARARAQNRLNWSS